MHRPNARRPGRAAIAGLTLIEMMVTMVIGAFLMIGVISIFAQSRTAYRTNDTIQRMQENVRFALAAIQPDIRLARNWGMTSESTLVTVPAGVAVTCPGGADVSAWTLNPLLGVEATNGVWPAALPCPAFGNAFQPGSDVLVVRHASDATTVPTNNVIQIQSNRVTARVFNGGVAPLGGVCPPVCSYDWLTHVYYVSSSSSLGPNVPSLRRKTLVNGVLQDQELITGVEDLQVELGVDTTGDNTVDRYVDADQGLVTPGDPAYDPDARVLAVRVWLMFRAEQPETGFVDGATYNYADVANYAPGDTFRRVLVNKTILVRNSRG